MAIAKGSGPASAKAASKKSGGAVSKTSRSTKTGRLTPTDTEAGASAGHRTYAIHEGASASRSAEAPPVSPVDWKAAERADFLIETFGGVTKLADALGVAKSQPGRWRSGKERPGVTAARNLLDLDHVMGRAIQVWTPDVAARWMHSSNAFLDGATPIDVLLTRGPNDVVRALDATMSGAFA
jgi:uncharacterized protein (DUF2384 family)